MSLNPHVVGRFFRDLKTNELEPDTRVLIPMWWGGFSEFRAEVNNELASLS